ncbi:MAG: HEAT repeat domain-containing protein [Burkholderiales bacterium]|nr:HEAT repeat domain-containing protein [Anaerolineae bacterium]
MPVRHWLSAAIGSCGCREGIDLLLAALQESDAALRYVTAWALGELRMQDAVEPLREVLKGELSNYERHVMESALQKILENNGAMTYVVTEPM